MLTIVPAASAYIVERLGRYHRTLLPGAHFLVPLIDRVAHRLSLAPRDSRIDDRCITHDNVPVDVTSVDRWRIHDPERAAYAVADCSAFVEGVVRNAQRNWISQRPLDRVQGYTRELESAVVSAVAEAAEGIGVTISEHTVERIDRV